MADSVVVPLIEREIDKRLREHEKKKPRKEKEVNNPHLIEVLDAGDDAKD